MVELVPFDLPSRFKQGVTTPTRALMILTLVLPLPSANTWDVAGAADRAPCPALSSPALADVRHLLDGPSGASAQALSTAVAQAP